MQRALRIFFLLLTVSFVSGLQAFAQQSKIFRVIVQDEGLQPISGANVLIYLPGEEDFLDYCVSDNDGFCEFRGLTVSVIEVKISFIGYGTYETELELRDTGVTLRTITLEVSQSELDELLVVADRNTTVGEVGITRVTPEDLSRIPSVSIEGDLMTFLQTVPGVITIGDQGGDLYIRGGTPAQNKFLIDNIPIVKPFHISNLFSAFPEQVIRSVDIIAGGFDAEYMGSTSAIIDARLKVGNLKKFTSSVSFSPYISSAFVEGPVQEDKRSFMINARASTINQFSNYLGTGRRDLSFYDVIGRYSLQGDGFTCSLTGILTEDRGRINIERENYLGWSNTGLGARCFGYDEQYDHPFELSVGFSRFENTEGSSTNVERRASVVNSYMRFDLEEVVSGVKVNYGINIQVKGFSARLGDRFTLVQEFDRIVPTFQVYTKTEWEINDYLTVLPSIGSQFTTLRTPTFEPRFRILYRPFANNRFEISAATGIYNQLYDGITDQRDAGTTFTAYRPNDIGDPLPAATHAMLGIRKRFGSAWTANLEGYYKKHRYIPVSKWQPVAQLEIETAFASSENYGFDATLRYERPNIYAYLGYGWSKSEYSAESEDLGAWIQETIFSYSPPHDQRHKLNTVLSFDIGKFTTSTSWELGSGLPYTQVVGFDLFLNVPIQDPVQDSGLPRTLYNEPYGKRLPYYHRLDVSVKRSFEPSERLSIITELGCINVYDRSNVFYIDLNVLERVDQTPILPYAAIKLSFN